MMWQKSGGGIHPNGNKNFTADKEIKTLTGEDIMAYPMSQHIGAPAVPCVKIGDEVKVGDKIGESGSFVSAPVHSSVSGKVKMIEKHKMQNGAYCDHVVIANDGEYKAADGYGLSRDFNNLTNDEIINIIADSGVVGMGGAGFPTHVKLSPKNRDEIKYIIINGAECEPYLTSDYRLMIEKGEDIISGIKIIMRLFKNATAVIAVESNKPQAIKLLSGLCGNEKNITVKSLKTRYPQGGERVLINTVTGEKINSKMLPADVGAIVINVSTVYAVYNAVCNSIPLISRVITVTGDGVENPCNVNVPLGVSLKYIAQQCGLRENAVKIISGGPMMGAALDSLDYPVTKTTSSILAVTSDDVENMKTSACIKCGKCVGACPERLVPQLLAAAAEANDLTKFQKLYGMECIECGCCTYVCPAKRPLTQLFKYTKLAVKNYSNNAVKEG